jgi:hypothetical protein
MNPLLRDLLDLQFWADAELWAPSRLMSPIADKAIHHRYHHLHQVQRFFVWAVGDRATQPPQTEPEDFNSMARLREYARESHDQIRRCLELLAEERLSQSIVMPWAREAAVDHGHRSADADGTAQPSSPGPERDAPAGTWRRAAADRFDHLVLEGPSLSDALDSVVRVFPWAAVVNAWRLPPRLAPIARAPADFRARRAGRRSSAAVRLPPRRRA